MLLMLLALQVEDARFEKIKSLAGEWAMEGTEEVAATYRVTAGGSAVIETLFVGTKKEMVTVYHMDGETLRMTHYCMAGNQPRMKAGALEDGALSFECDGVGNVESHDAGHMHALTLTFTGEKTLTHAWTWGEGGEAGEPKTFKLVRKP